MDKVTGARGQPRCFTWVGGYRPQKLDRSTWVTVKPFVATCAEELALDGGAASLRKIRVLARLAGWALGEGLPLDVEVVLDPDTVERFIASGVDHDRSQATYRSELRRLGPLLTRHAPWEARPRPVARRRRSANCSARACGPSSPGLGRRGGSGRALAGTSEGTRRLRCAGGGAGAGQRAWYSSRARLSRLGR